MEAQNRRPLALRPFAHGGRQFQHARAPVALCLEPETGGFQQRPYCVGVATKEVASFCAQGIGYGRGSSDIAITS